MMIDHGTIYLSTGCSIGLRSAHGMADLWIRGPLHETDVDLYVEDLNKLVELLTKTLSEMQEVEE